MEADIDTGFVTLRPHTIAVEQNGTLAYVMASRLSYYDARWHEAQTLAHLRMLERAHMRAMATHLDRWCSDCGDTRPVSYFSPKADARDGLHPHCKECRNIQKREHYRLEREALGLPVRAYNRKQANDVPQRVIEVDFTPLKRAA